MFHTQSGSKMRHEEPYHIDILRTFSRKKTHRIRSVCTNSTLTLRTDYIQLEPSVLAEPNDVV